MVSRHVFFLESTLSESVQAFDTLYATKSQKCCLCHLPDVMIHFTTYLKSFSPILTLKVSTYGTEYCSELFK